MSNQSKQNHRTHGSMRFHRGLLCGVSLAASIVALSMSTGARADDRHWDANGTAVGTGGTGTWNLGNLNWSPSGDGVSGPYSTPWSNAALDNAIFGGTAGTVTIGAPIIVHNLTFNVAGYTLAGGTLTLGGVSPTITTAGNNTIDSIITGSSGLVKAGAGGLILNGNNTFTGDILLNLGSLYAGSDAALGNTANNIFTAAGATVRLSITGAETNRTVTIGNAGTLILEGAGAGSALIIGNGKVSVAASGVTMSNDASTYTGQTIFAGCNGVCSTRFTSIGNLGQASSLGAPVTVLDGTIVFNQQSQYSDSIIYLGDGDSSDRNWDINGNGAIIRNQGTGTLTITGDVDVSAGGSFYAETANFELLGILSGGAYAFNGASGNVVTLGSANTFTGAASIGGLVKASVLADIGAVSSLGAGTNITLSTGSLSYTGTGNSSNRVWIANGAGGILNDGTGALNLSGTATFAVGGAADSLTLGGTFAGENSFSGAISGAGNLIGNGAGTWVLGGASDFIGSVTVNAGTLKAGNASAFGGATGFIVNGGTLDLDGYDLIAPSLSGTGGTVALGSANLTVDTATGMSFAGLITGTGGLTKAGIGTLTLSRANSYTGATTVNGGTLNLGFNSPGAPVADIISSVSTLNMAGGTVTVFGGAGQDNVQTFNGLNVLAGNNRISAQASATGSVTINFGAVNRAGGLIDFALPATGNFTTSNTSLGGWATINGTDYAKVVGGNIVAFTDADYTDQDDASLWTVGQYISDSDGDAESFSGTVASNVQLAGLQFTTFDPTTTVTIAPAVTLGIDGTIIIAPSVGTNNQTITGGSLTGGTGGSILGVQQNGGGIFTIASTMVNNGGATSFAKNGTGTVRLTGANSYTGGTTLSGGRLEVMSLANGGVNSSIGASSADPANLRLESGTLAYIGGSDAVSDRGITLVNGGSERAIQVDASRTVEFSGLVASPDDAGLTKTGWGTLVLSNAANDYIGVTTITGGGSGNKGTLSVNTLSNGGVASGMGAATSASANLVMSADGTLQYTGSTVSTDRGFTLAGGNGRIDVAQAGTTLTVSGMATGAGTFVKDGTGTLILSGANTYAGDNIVNTGTLRAGSSQAFGLGGRYMTVNSGATLELGGFNILVGALIGTGTVDLGSNTLTSAGGPGVFSGRITGSGGFTRGAGSYTQTITGCNNDYTGATTLMSALSIDCIANGGQASSIGASSAAASNLSFANGTLVYTGASVSTDRGIAMTGNGALNVFDAATTLEFSGTITGGGQLSKEGAGTLLLSGTNNTAGNMRVINGTLRAGSTTALRSGFMSLNDTAGILLDLDGYDNNVLYLIGGGATGGNVALGTATLTINTGGSAAAVFGGAISGSGGLIKNGASFQQLSGCASSYSGTTVINGGTFAVTCLEDGGANSSIGSSSSAASNLVINGGALQYVGAGGTTNRQFTLGASTTSKLDASGAGAIAFTHAGPLIFSSPNTAQTLTLGGVSTANNILAGQITNNGTGLTRLTKTDAGTWILTNPGSTYTGITTISGGVLGVDKLADGGLASSLGASSAAAGNLVIGNGSTLRYTGTGDTTNRLFTLSSGVTFIESSGTGAVVFTYTGPVTLANNNQARTIALGGTNAGNNTLAGSIGNAGTGVTTLAKNDSGTWVLTGNHSYTGSTNINGGLLSIGSGGTTGSIASTIVNNFGTLAFNRSDSLTYAGSIVGTGALQQNGAGTTILTGDSSYAGGTTISAGILQLGNGGATGSIIGDVVDNGVLIFNRSSNLTFNGVISGSGTVRQEGGGTTVLTGTNSYTGGTVITGGRLQISRDANLGAASGPLSIDGLLETTADITSSRNVELTGHAFLLVNAGTTFRLNGVVSGVGSLDKRFAGTLILTADNLYTGRTAIGDGMLQLGDGGTSGAILGDVVNDGSLVFNRSDDIGFAGLVSGTGSLTQNGTGSVTLTADNSYTGATNINAGKLRINGDQSAATGLVAVSSGATLGGSGIIGGDVNVVDGGILAPGNSPGTMTINGNLLLSSGSVLNFEFGQADVAGGPLNDLVNVGGDLRLDGTINVDVPVGGIFGGGIYRVFNYGGVLTDNGLTLGTMPFGSDVSVQTSMAGQVNLINAAGLALNFWDGDAGPKVNDLVDGGDGTWHIGGVDKNWTNAAGAVNAAYEDGAFAIFAGTGGTVSIDNGGGAVTASGMQFASDGYLVTGAPLTLTDPQSIIRVGDGTATGAGFVTTIAAGLTGAAQLVKTDLGTLVLTGSNSYTGGTLISDGVLSVANDSFLGDPGGAVTIDGGTLQLTGSNSSNLHIYNLGANGGAIDITNVATANGVLNGMSGVGGLTKLGAGSLALSGANTYTGGTTVQAGTLIIGGFGGLTTGSIVGDVVNNATLTFDRSNAYTYAGSITGTGNLVVASTGVTTLTGNSSYAGGTRLSGVNGQLRIAGGANVISGGTTTLTRSTLSIDGANSLFSTASIGGTITGTGATIVNVTNGGTLRTTTGGVDLRALSNVSVQINVDGANSLVDLAGGIQGSTTYNAPFSTTISAGGTLRTGGVSQIGLVTSTTNPIAVAITGAGSNWTSSGSLLMTGGDFTVIQGGAASFASATFGTAPRTTNLLVSGTGSSLGTTGDLVIGSGGGTASLLLTAGGQVTTGGTLTLAQDAGSSGTLTIGGDSLVRVSGGTLAMGPGNAALNIGGFGMVPGGATAGVLDAAELTFAAATNIVNFNHVNTDYVFATRMSGLGEVYSSGTGTTILTADNAYTGATNINSGTLIVNGDQSAATGMTNVSAGGTLGGRGVIGGSALVSGRLAPGDIDAAPGTLTIKGDLFNLSGANLDYNFGQANVVGGAYNDLINVEGNLTLDGTLNVTVSPGGSFDPGVYRVINYGGTLTNNSLDVDPAYFVQTSVANQVNLVNTTGLNMRFWDGVAGAKNDGVITGGDGLWQASSGNDNWTEYDGSVNAPFTNQAFAVFSGLGGTVTVDSSLGAVNASGMQFASDGYLIEGEDLTLVTPQSIIRVGDGTTGGAAYTATITSNLTSVGDLVKSDLGTLVLTGTNGIAGDVSVRGGELRLADGGTITSVNGIVAAEAGDEAIITVAGSDGSGNASTWTVGTDLQVGYSGNGTLNVVDGGRVVSNTVQVGLDSNGIGQVLVSGTGSSWENSGRISVGLFGAGVLRIENGATVTSNDGIVGGSEQGDVIVSGTATSWVNTQQLNVGSFGAGTMRIESGASVTSNQGYIGANAAGSVTVTGTGSNWLVTDFSMTVGNEGAGSLTIDDGGRVRAEGGFFLGVAAASNGTVALLGTSGNRGVLETSQIRAGAGAVNFTMDGGLLRATADNDDFFVDFGTRDLTLGVNGGVIDTNGHDVGITPRFVGTGGLIKDGLGTLTLAGASNYAGATLVNAGILIVNGDQSAATGLTTVSSGATLGGHGVIGGNVNMLDGAILAPGESVGTLTINGNLSLAGGSILDYEFGQANVAGGPLNDLVNVGGDLVLDGRINVRVPAGGDFGPGIYRVINYGGTLTDNGLTLGAMPNGSTPTVQTSIAGQVNLVNTDGLALNFWDGNAGPKFNSAVDGGDGVWQNGTGNDNWTDAAGTVNAAYADGTFAIFAGTGGGVTIDNSLDSVSASGMQFAANGYEIGGEALMLVGPQSTIRVGDGSTAGASFTATISAALTGNTQLVKTDAGKLILSGVNSFTGGTSIQGGTLAISADANLGDAAGGLSIGGGTLQTTANLTSNRALSLIGESTLLTDQGTTFTLGGWLSGAGALTKNGAGMLVLDGNNAGYAAATNVAGGTLVVDGLLGSVVTVAAAGRLEGIGQVGGIANSGIVAPGRNGVGTLTVAGDYVGNGGTLEIETVLGNDSSQTSRLVVNGATSGATQVAVTNRGGLGAQTVEGIKIIDIAGASNGGFTLNGDYVFQGEQAVIAGAYGYRLYKGAVTGPTDGDWYLRSSLTNPTNPVDPTDPVDPTKPAGPLYQPGVPVYEAYGQSLLALNGLPTLQQRVGNRSWAGDGVQGGKGVWGRMEGSRQRPSAVISTSDADKNINSWQMQMGLDATLSERSDGATLIGGITTHYGKVDTSIGSIYGNGSIDTQGYGLGATLTWYGPQGFYADGQAQMSWFDSDLKSAVLGKLADGHNGKGQAFSLEVGKRSPVGKKLTLTPQIQMIYSHVTFDRFADPAGAMVSAGKDDSLRTRGGISLDHQNSWDSSSGDTRRSHIYGLVNLSYEWLDGTRTDVSGTPILNRDHRLLGELGLGASYSWGEDRFTLFSEISADTSIADFGDSYSLKGNAGIRIQF